MRNDHMPTIHPSKRLIVALSDIHIGDGGPTCWYQPDVHERYLFAILDWVKEHADEVRELVLLGDVVDLWTYPFQQQPPSFAEVAAANPSIFGPGGAIPQVLDALDGAVTWVPGNHDMGIEAEEAALVVGGDGHPLRLLEGLEYQPLSPDTRLLMSHGHAHTLFNAIDETSRWQDLPSGHFVTRAVAEHWHRNLPDGLTVADLPGQGAPNGLDLQGIATALAGTGGDGIVGLLFDYLEGSLDVDAADAITMPDGSLSTLAEARESYRDVWQRWADSEGGGNHGAVEAMRATWGDAMEQLAWFAQSDAVRTHADLVVMGHTHGAVSDLDNPFTHYLNAGFECPSSADASERPVTFAVIDVGDATDPESELSGSVWTVEDDGGVLRCVPTEAPTEAIVQAGAMDFSCYLEIDNRRGTSDLRLESAEATSGRFVHHPPETISVGQRVRIWVKDDLGPFGSGAEVLYSADDGRSLRIDLSCPTGLFPNRCRATVPFIARSGHSPWGEQNDVRRIGHPLFVQLSP